VNVRRPRVLFYAVNGLGLGHVTRLIAIARKVRSRVPESEIVFLTSSEAESVIFREGFAAFKVPSKTLRAEANIRSTTYARLLQTVVINLVSAFNPHLLVVDTFPAGVIQELLPVLRWDVRKVFVYRAQRLEAATSALMQNTLQMYDLALIPHHPDEEDTPLPPGLPSVWTGPIVIRDRTEALPKEQARRQMGLPEDAPVVYITYGGGGDAEAECALRTSVEALWKLPVPGLHLAVASAPLYRGRLPRGAGIVPVDHFPMAEMAAAFDAAVSAVGYNTTMELLHHGVPTVFIPFARQVDDQEARARQIAAAGAGLMLPALEPSALSSAVMRLLDPREACLMRECAHEMVPDSGAGRAAEAILNLLAR
jgi:UDP:flavonoid glycosyltransferase YjiC (YdhE family)